jgi:hypothetical protein
MKANSQNVNAQVESTIVALLDWAEDAMIAATDLAVDITMAPDSASVDAIELNTATLTSNLPSKPPPGQLLKLLRGI